LTLCALSSHLLKFKNPGIPGLFWSGGDYWTETRRATYNLLKEFGLGKASVLEPRILEELKVTINQFKSQLQNGVGVIEIDHQFEAVYMNIVWSLMTGTRFEHDDPKFKRLLRLNRSYEECGQIGGGIGGLFPKLLYMAPNWTGYTKLQAMSIALREYAEVDTSIFG